MEKLHKWPRERQTDRELDGVDFYVIAAKKNWLIVNVTQHFHYVACVG